MGWELGKWERIATWEGGSGDHHVLYIKAEAKERVEAEFGSRDSDQLRSMVSGDKGTPLPGIIFAATTVEADTAPERATDYGAKPYKNFFGRIMILGNDRIMLDPSEYSVLHDLKIHHKVVGEAKQFQHEIDKAVEHAAKDKAESEARAKKAREEAVGKVSQHWVSVDGKLLSSLWGKVAEAAAKEQDRPVLTGVRVEKVGKLLKLTATGGFRLYHAELPITGGTEGGISEDWAATIPARDGRKLRKLDTGKEAVIQFVPVSGYYEYQATTPVVRRFGSLTGGEPVGDIEYSPIAGMMLDGKTLEGISGTFPNYGQLIPDSGDLGFVFVSRDELVNALAELKSIAKEGSGIVRVTPKKGDQGSIVEFTAVKGARGDSAPDPDDENKTVTLQTAGPEARGGFTGIAFNWDYLNDVAVKVFDKGEVVGIGAATKSSPGLFIGSKVKSVVVMPMFVQW